MWHRAFAVRCPAPDRDPVWDTCPESPLAVGFGDTCSKVIAMRSGSAPGVFLVEPDRSDRTQPWHPEPDNAVVVMRCGSLRDLARQRIPSRELSMRLRESRERVAVVPTFAVAAMPRG